jgi:multiple sugar transport system permease protein
MRGKRSLAHYERYWAWAMSLPGLAVLITFVLVPLLLGFGWSFTNKRLISPLPSKIVGMENYSSLLSLKRITLLPLTEQSGAVSLDEGGSLVYPELRDYLRSGPDGHLADYAELRRFERDGKLVVWVAKDPTFWRALLNTLRFVLVIVPCQGGLALILALLVNVKLKGRNVFRTIFFAPVVTSMAVIAIVWIFILNPNQGLLNNFLARIMGEGFTPVRWLTDKKYAHISIYLVSIWQSAGFQMIIFLAGLQGIPEYLYESARIDGARRAQCFRHITFPMLRNTTVFVVISTTILAFRVFTQIDVMTKGGPEESTVSLIYYVIQRGFREQRIGYASAITFIFFLFVLLVSLAQKLVLKSEKEIE